MHRKLPCLSAKMIFSWVNSTIWKTHRIAAQLRVNVIMGFWKPILRTTRSVAPRQVAAGTLHASSFRYTINMKCVQYPHRAGKAVRRSMRDSALIGLHLVLARLRFDVGDGDSTTYTHNNEVELNTSQLYSLYKRASRPW